MANTDTFAINFLKVSMKLNVLGLVPVVDSNGLETTLSLIRLIEFTWDFHRRGVGNPLVIGRTLIFD